MVTGWSRILRSGPISGLQADRRYRRSPWSGHYDVTRRHRESWDLREFKSDGPRGCDRATIIATRAGAPCDPGSRFLLARTPGLVVGRQRLEPLSIVGRSCTPSLDPDRFLGEL